MAHTLQVGTAVVTRQDKRLAVGRLGALVEQIEALVSKDLQVILVCCLRHLFVLWRITSNRPFSAICFPGLLL